MSVAMCIESREPMCRSRHALNADGYASDGCTALPFVTKEFKTAARTESGRLYFGTIRDKSERELPARGIIRWAQQREEPAVLDVVFRWFKPQTGLWLDPGQLPIAPAQAVFEQPVDAVRIESFRNRTLITFGRLAIGCDEVELVPVTPDWQTSEYFAQQAQDLLVGEHFDKIVCGKVERALRGEIPVEA